LSGLNCQNIGFRKAEYCRKVLILIVLSVGCKMGRIPGHAYLWEPGVAAGKAYRFRVWMPVSEPGAAGKPQTARGMDGQRLFYRRLQAGGIVGCGGYLASVK
jgi:hypothetical protein